MTTLLIARNWPALLVASACAGIATSVWVRPPPLSIGVLTAACATGALLSGGARRLAFAGVALACTGLWWGSLRSDALDQSALVGRIGDSASARVVVTGPPPA